MIKIYSRYDRPSIEGLTFIEPSLTQQNFDDECDINRIIRRAIQCGDTTVFSNPERAHFYDCTSIGDYQNAMDTLLAAREDFESLPSKTRAYFGNDLESYVAFMTNPANGQHMIDLGLIDAPAEKPAVTLPVSGAGEPPAGALTATKTD